MQKMTRVEVLLLFRKDYTKQSQAAEVQLKAKVVLLWAGLSTDLKFNSKQYWTPSSWFRVWLAFVCFDKGVFRVRLSTFTHTCSEQAGSKRVRQKKTRKKDKQEVRPPKKDRQVSKTKD